MTDTVYLLQQSPALLTGCCFVLGLVVGSFLNVVILRFPALLEHQWRLECAELDGETFSAEPPPGLVWARSRCPRCGHAITALENIPLLSYLLLRGRCSACGGRISPRYPAIELAAGLLSAAVAWHFGFDWAMLAALGLTWTLLVLAVIDIDHQILPDAITLPVMWAGLLLALTGIFASPVTSIVGAAAGYLSLWAVYHAFRLLTGKEGMGYGDFKLLALLGAWLGWQALPGIILISSLAGAVLGMAWLLIQRRDSQVPIPFGPYLALGGWIMLMWGGAINAGYLRFAGIG
ncbi:MAG TPA: A24 family peptidase [Gammaproteobacteria bacterium]|nr:A24 family peptidase [Gammaproteobacteria bacterium]